MPKVLNESQLEQFRRDGVVFPLTALTAAEAGALVPRFEALKERMNGWSAGQQILKSHVVSTWVADLVRNPPILDAVEDLIGPNILCWTATFFAKSSQAVGFVGWHQDMTYWGLAPPEKVVTAWLGLTDSAMENGCMQVIPGTHREPDREEVHNPATGNMLMSEQNIVLSEAELAAALPIELGAGQFSVHHSWLVHGSAPNASPRPRIGLSINYMASEVRQTASTMVDSAMLVRGRDDFGHFDLEPVPEEDFDDATLTAYRKAIQAPSGVGRAGEHPRALNRPGVGAEA